MSKEIENKDANLMDEEGDEYEVELITLVDENGEEQEYEVIDSIEEPDGSEYLALIPVHDGADDALQDSGDLIILKVIEADGEEILEAIEDDDEFDRVGAIFKERLKDAFDFEN